MNGNGRKGIPKKALFENDVVEVLFVMIEMLPLPKMQKGK